MANRRLFVLFKNHDDLVSGERLLRKTTEADVLRLGRRITYQGGCPESIFVRNVPELRAWLRSAKHRPTPKSFLLALTEEFDVYRQNLAALASMKVRPSHLLFIGQDQIVVFESIEWRGGCVRLECYRLAAASTPVYDRFTAN